MKPWKRVLDIGISETDVPKEKKRVRLLNLVAYISIVHALFFLIFDYISDVFDNQKGITLGTQLFLFFTIVYIQYKRQFQLARILFFFLVFAILFYHCNYAFKGFYGEYQYIVLPLISLFFFDKNYIHYTVLVISVAAFYIPNMYYKIYPEAYFGYFNVVLLFVGLFLLVNFFKRQNEKYEDLLKKEKDTVITDKMLLEKQKTDLKKLNNFKTHFFTNISHELRTPITLIQGYVNQINLKEEDSTNNESLKVIKTQVNELKDIVDSLLDLSKLDAKKLELNRSTENIVIIIHSIYRNFKKLFLDKGISFYLQISDYNLLVYLDKNYFTKSLYNLISNSLKFTPSGGEVTIALKYDGHINISITDNGIGIPEEDQAKIFERFYQSKNDITESLGSGLGLSFAKSILNEHLFQLSLESIPNQKTCFNIHIPQRYVSIKTNTPLEEDNQLKKSNKEVSKPTILIVEDNIEMQRYLHLILKDYNIITANNGKEGLERLLDYKVDAIVTDYMMPVMNGLEFVEALKSKGIKSPVLVLTARNDEASKLDMLRVGIDAYYTKPFIEEELQLKLKQSIYYYKQLRAYEHDIPLKEKLDLRSEENEFYDRLIATIHDHIKSKNFGVDQLADNLNLSRSSLFRRTKLLLGQTPNEVIKEIRFQKAKQLLLNNPNIKKKDLANAIGVYNATYFYDNLKERFNF
jgi:signal transduction histidine kinase/CheY-like chemotaxis protein